MMKLTALALFGLACLAFTQTAMAQKEYIVTLKRDTLWGEVSKTIFGKPRFAEAGQSKTIAINVKNTKAYHRIISLKKSETFVARILPEKSKPIFLQLHEQGDIQLYEMERTSGTMYGSVTVTSWFASKGDGPLIYLKTSGLSFARAEKENNFEQLLGDSPALWAKFKAEKSFSFSMLRNYIKLYNQEKKTMTTSK